MKLSDLKPGDTVQVDDGFTCMIASLRVVQDDKHGGLYVPCNDGNHLLDGQRREDGELVGITWPGGVAPVREG